MTRQQVENIVFMTHSPLTVGEVMKAIDEYAEDIRADERERIVNELENLSDQYFQKVALDIIDIAIEIVRGGENE